MPNLRPDEIQEKIDAKRKLLGITENMFSIFKKVRKPPQKSGISYLIGNYGILPYKKENEL